MPIRLDLNNAQFQTTWFALGREDRDAVMRLCIKLARMDWEAIYRDQGLRWEAIQSRRGPGQSLLYSIRVTQRMRAVVQRSGDFLEFLSLHADHDSAYT